MVLYTQLSIYTKLVIYQTSSKSLQPIKTIFLSLTEYFNILGLTSKSVEIYEDFYKVILLVSFPSL